MSTPAKLADLLTLLESGATLLLPAARAARALRFAFDRHQQSLGRSAWQPPAVFSWEQWTTSLWSDLIVSGAEPRLLLNAAQEHSLWREIVSADPSTNALSSPDALADLARSAFHLAASFNAVAFNTIDRLRSTAATHDARTFADWTAAFTRLCAARGYLSSALLDDALRNHLEASTLSAPSTLHLIGFTDLPPAQESLLTALRQNQTEVLRYSLKATSPSLRASTIAPTERDELVLAARWIRSFLETHPDPAHASVAVLVPNLNPGQNDARAEIESVFREVLAPELQSIAADLSSTPWEIAAGVPLASLALIGSALDLVRWAASPLPIERVSSLLLSPFLGDPPSTSTTTNSTTNSPQDTTTTPHEIIAQFDASVLRRTRLLRPEISISGLLSLLEGPKARALTPGRQPPLLWPRHLHTFLQRHGDLTRPRAFADWTEFLRELLRTVNWPNGLTTDLSSRPESSQRPGSPASGLGSLGWQSEDAVERPAVPTTARALTATEAAAAEAWDSLLDLIATLDFSGRRIPFSTALEALEQQLQTTPFQPPRTHAPVQVLSPADSTGCLFDATVFLRSTDANWPPPQRANPLLPWPLQRSLRMPGTDPTLTAERARAFIADLLARSGSVLFTSAAEDTDGLLRPSPLLAELNIPSLPAADLITASPPAASIQLETVFDDTPLPPLPSPEIHGGSAVLQAQAACGFRAFAEFRLHAAEPQLTGLGLDAADSGSSVHRALQHLWKTLQTQQTLRSKTPEEREQLIALAIDDTMSRFHPETAWERAYIDLQKQRLRTLLRQWIEVELQRGDFAVLESEIAQPIDIGPLTLKLRLDRIDKVANGFFVVDYKTGASGHPKQWEGERPDDPQLPLYALLHEPEEIQGLAFAKVRAGEMLWLGLQSAPGLLPASRINKIVDLPTLLAEWRETLTQLAHDFAAGRAAVNPKHYPQTCAHCAQRLLCRLDPASLHNAFSDDAEESHEAPRSATIRSSAAARRNDG